MLLLRYRDRQILCTKLFVDLRDIVRREQRDVLVIDKALVEQLRDLNTVVQFTDTVVFSTFVILEDEDVLDFLVEDWEVDSR